MEIKLTTSKLGWSSKPLGKRLINTDFQTPPQAHGLNLWGQNPAQEWLFITRLFQLFWSLSGSILWDSPRGNWTAFAAHTPMVTGSMSLSLSEQERRIHCWWVSHWSSPTFSRNPGWPLERFHLWMTCAFESVDSRGTWMVCLLSATGGHPEFVHQKDQSSPMFSLSREHCPQPTDVLGNCWCKHACVFSDLKHKDSPLTFFLARLA